LVFVAAGLTEAPTAFKGGTLVPVPILLLLPLATGPTGTAHATVPGGGGPLSIDLQAVFADATLPGGFGLSNAVRVDLLP
jgi:hypothetical protein